MNHIARDMDVVRKQVVLCGSVTVEQSSIIVSIKPIKIANSSFADYQNANIVKGNHRGGWLQLLSTTESNKQN